ncbi:MAG: glycosyltransferase [Acidobacteriota bacterium]
MTPRISLIIPAYNEEALLPRLLESVDIASTRFSADADSVEVIVVDNDSTDDTARLAEAAGCRVLSEKRRCIATVRNTGASAASAPTLCFVDADSVLHPEIFSAVLEASRNERIVAGSSRVRPEVWSFGLWVSFHLTMPPMWLLGLDTGLFFIRRSDFRTLGGYPEDRQYAEDIQLYLAARRLGRSRSPRQRLARLRGVRTITSTRKFDKHGDWHLLTTLVRYVLLRPFKPRWADEFSQRYWYEDR